MKNCLIIINQSAGGAEKISFDYVKNRLGNRYQYTCHTIPTDGEPNTNGYEAIAVCGGDGTLTNLLAKVYDRQIDVFYFPSGTLNDKAKIKSGAKACNSPAIIGRVSGEYPTVFSYVYAAGSFTPIGYTANVKMKKRFGVLAYLGDVLKEYKVHHISAEIEIDGKTYKDDYTLIMLLKSPRCFGFEFNKAYDEKSESGHIVLIRAPKGKGLCGKIAMFFPFFRVFFIGLKKEREGVITFKRFDSLMVKLEEKTTFCRDGERDEQSGDFKVHFVKTKCNLNIIPKTKMAFNDTKTAD